MFDLEDITFKLMNRNYPMPDFLLLNNFSCNSFDLLLVGLANTLSVLVHTHPHTPTPTPTPTKKPTPTQTHTAKIMKVKNGRLIIGKHSSSSV